jgi:hypothetical protein
VGSVGIIGSDLASELVLQSGPIAVAFMAPFGPRWPLPEAGPVPEDNLLYLFECGPTNRAITGSTVAEEV